MLHHLIDGYLFHDLKNMAEVEQKKGENGGGVGYPMLATCVSGMELLGGLLYNEDYSHKEDRIYFEHYWNEYLVKAHPAYKSFARLFWSLVRNGVAHTYMAKTAITVTKGQKEHHLIFYDNNTKLNIDSLEFYKDFLESYKSQVKPKLSNTSALTSQVEKNIGIMLKESDDHCKKIFAELRATLAKEMGNPSTHVGPTPSGTNTPATTTTTLIPDDVREKLAQDFRTKVSPTSRISGASLASPEALQSLKRKLEQDDEPRPTMSGVI